MKFAHKGLKRFACSHDKSGIIPAHSERLKMLLDKLKNVEKGESLRSFDRTLHVLNFFEPKAKDTIFAVSVSGAWRLTFKFDGENVKSVNYLNYH